MGKGQCVKRLPRPFVWRLDSNVFVLSKIQKCRPFIAFYFGKSIIAIELKFRNVISAFQWFLFLGLLHENSNTNNQASFCDFILVAKFNFIFVTDFLTSVATIESEGVIIDGNMASLHC